jgi:hypothetical protein
MLSLSQLVTPVTEDEALETCLSILSQFGFNATTWQSGSVQLMIVRLFCRIYSAWTNTVAEVAAGGFTTLASTAFLRLLAKYFYDIDYIQAQPTIGQFLLTSSAGAPVHTFVAGDVIVANVASGEEGISYTCTEGGTLNPGSTLSIEFKADVAGADANLAPDTALFLWTPLVGVTVTCPALVPDSNTWITTPGANDESDARLVARCIGRWSRLTYGNTDGAYIGWALEALPALERVAIERAAGDGTVTIIGATTLGGLTGDQITEIEDYVNGVADGVGRRPINDIISVESAVEVTTPAITVTAYLLSEALDTAPAEIEASLLAYIGSIPIGGTKLTNDTGYVLVDSLLEACKSRPTSSGKREPIPGVKKIALSISADIELASNEIYAPAITVNTIPVAPGLV